MGMKNKMDVKTEGNKLILSRIFDAPPELMFEMWSSCEHLKHWWGSREWPMEECRMVFEKAVNGIFVFAVRMRGMSHWDWLSTRKSTNPGKLCIRIIFRRRRATSTKRCPE